LPHGEFGLDLIALIGTLRYVHHRSVPEIHRALLARSVLISERTVTNLLARYEELVTLHLTDQARLRQLLLTQGFVILALDGLQPDVGHEVLWVLRDCPSGEVLLARSLLSASEADLAVLLREVQVSLPVPIRGVVTDGQHSIRNAVQGVCLLQKCISRMRLSLYWPAAPRGDKYGAVSLLPPPLVCHLAR